MAWDRIHTPLHGVTVVPVMAVVAVIVVVMVVGIVISVS